MEILSTDIHDYLDALNLLRVGGVNSNVIEFILDMLIPKDNHGSNLIKTSIKDTSFRDATCFIPQTRVIHVSIDKVKKWLDTNTADISEKSNCSDQSKLRNYLLIFMLLHEVEHSKQFLIGEGELEHSSLNVSNGYKNLFDLIILKYSKLYPDLVKRVRRLYSLYIYDKKHDFYVLERNANIEACDALMHVCLVNNELELYRLFNSLRQSFLKIGYKNSKDGSFYETYKDMKILKKYNDYYVDEKLDEILNLRYGLPISEKTRGLVLKK